MQTLAPKRQFVLVQIDESQLSVTAVTENSRSEVDNGARPARRLSFPPGGGVGNRPQDVALRKQADPGATFDLRVAPSTRFEG